jgi:hypothetical protein
MIEYVIVIISKPNLTTCLSVACLSFIARDKLFLLCFINHHQPSNYQKIQGSYISQYNGHFIFHRQNSKYVKDVVWRW